MGYFKGFLLTEEQHKPLLLEVILVNNDTSYGYPRESHGVNLIHVFFFPFENLSSMECLTMQLGE